MELPTPQRELFRRKEEQLMQYIVIIALICLIMTKAY